MGPIPSKTLCLKVKIESPSQIPQPPFEPVSTLAASEQKSCDVIVSNSVAQTLEDSVSVGLRREGVLWVFWLAATARSTNAENTECGSKAPTMHWFPGFRNMTINALAEHFATKRQT